MKEDQNDHTSSHVLNASSNLLGLCFVVLTSLKILNLSHKTIIDELTTTCALLFMTSAILSFLSIKKKNRRYENNADYVFLCGLLILFATTLLFSFNIIH